MRLLIFGFASQYLKHTVLRERAYVEDFRVPFQGKGQNTLGCRLCSYTVVCGSTALLLSLVGDRTWPLEMHVDTWLTRGELWWLVIGFVSELDQYSDLGYWNGNPKQP